MWKAFLKNNRLWLYTTQTVNSTSLFPEVMFHFSVCGWISHMLKRISSLQDYLIVIKQNKTNVNVLNINEWAVFLKSGLNIFQPLRNNTQSENNQMYREDRIARPRSCFLHQVYFPCALKRCRRQTQRRRRTYRLSASPGLGGKWTLCTLWLYMCDFTVSYVA